MPFEGQSTASATFKAHDLEPQARRQETVQYTPSSAPFYGETTSGAAHKQFEVPRQTRQVQSPPPRPKVRFEGTTTAADTFKGWKLSGQRLSLGLETLGGLFFRLIPASLDIPCKRSEIFSTVADDQTVTNIKIYEGEREIAVENKLLGEFDLVDIPLAPRGVPQIEVTFHVNQDNILHVEARDKVTGRAQMIDVIDPYGLEGTEVQRLVQDARTHKSEDLSEKAVIEAAKEAVSERRRVACMCARACISMCRGSKVSSLVVEWRFFAWHFLALSFLLTPSLPRPLTPYSGQANLHGPEGRESASCHGAQRRGS